MKNLYDKVICNERSKVACLLAFCTSQRDGERRIRQLAQCSKKSARTRNVREWLRLWKKSGALTVWGGYKYSAKRRTYDACVVFFKPGYWRLTTVIHECSHVVKALFRPFMLAAARSPCVSKADETLACLFGNIVHSVYSLGCKAYGRPAAK